MALTEANRAGEFLLAEGNGYYSREEVTLVANSGALVAGTVLGKITKAGTASAVAFAGNTGDGAMGAITVGAGAMAGVYKLVITEPGTNVGNFIVEGPDGVVIGQGDVGSAFSAGGLSFTLADGAADFVAGDGFNITVAAGSGKYKPYNNANTDGSETAVAILYAPAVNSAADQAVAVIARHAEVDGNLLTGNDANGTADLAAVGIIVR